MLDVLIIEVALVIAVLVAAVWLALIPPSQRYRKATTIPGPDPADHKNGNLTDVAKAGSLYQFLSKLHGDYGPIASFWMGRQFVVSIASPELFKEHARVFDRPPVMFPEFELLMTSECIQFANGTDGRQRRKHYDSVYGHDTLDNYCYTLNKIGKELASTWGTIPRKQHIPVRQAMFTMAIKAITAVSFGMFFSEDKEVQRLLESYDVCWPEMESRISGDIPSAESPRQQRFDQHKKVIYEQMEKALKVRRAAGDTGESLLIDILLASGQPQSVLLADSVIFFVAGFQTTGLLMTWTLYYLAAHPEVQERVVAEMKEELGSEDVDARVMNKLVYLRQVLDETLRCSVLAPYAARLQDIDAELGGHKVPAGTPVIHALGVVLQDEKLYPEPTKFDPERMSPKKKSELPNYAFEPFGFAGKRKCPGYRLTYTAATVFLSILLRKFKVKLVEGQVVTPEHGLVTKPKEEILITIEERQES